jgi:Kip1 ubiquitination-promoting complex protein 2
MITDANNEESLDPNSSMYQAMMENPFIQQVLNNPKAFFGKFFISNSNKNISHLVLLQLYENPSLITTYINDREIGTMLLQISRIYQMNASSRS